MATLAKTAAVSKNASAPSCATYMIVGGRDEHKKSGFAHDLDGGLSTPSSALDEEESLTHRPNGASNDQSPSAQTATTIARHHNAAAISFKPVSRKYSV